MTTEERKRFAPEDAEVSSEEDVGPMPGPEIGRAHV